MVQALYRGGAACCQQLAGLRHLILQPVQPGRVPGAVSEQPRPFAHDLAEFNRVELMVAPALQTEGKQLQRDQAVGMGANGKAAAAALVAD